MERPETEGLLDDVYTFAVKLGTDAGHLLLDGVLKRMKGGAAEVLPATEKESSVDIVTQTDHDVEAFIHKAVLQRYPDHQFIGEESYSSSNSKTKEFLLTDAPTWIVDPLDGTVNYTHLFPSYCVSIAFCLDSRPVVGVICAPFLSQTFHACKGKGAWFATPSLGPEPVRLPLIRDPIPPLPQDAPKGCVFGCEWGKDRRDITEGNLWKKVESFVNMATEIGGRQGKGAMVHGIRSLGSATLDLAYVALGGIDIWWEAGCWEWDVAAGICILEEAGGIVTTAYPPDDCDTASVESASLGGRMYLAVRPTGSTGGETGRAAQERVVREVWKRVHRLDYTRPGV